MRRLPMLLLVVASLAPVPAMAAEAKVDIISPTDGSRLAAKAQNKLVYEIVMGGKASHAHMYVDGEETDVLRQMKASHMLDPLKPGMHEICIKLVNRNHTPIGVERCIKVTVE